jgi:hypothetical protein
MAYLPSYVGFMTLAFGILGQTAVMGHAVSDGDYVFLGFNAAGACPAMELVACADAGEAIDRARQWLASHRSCVRAQIWKDDTLLADVMA